MHEEDLYDGWLLVVYHASLKKMIYFQHPLAEKPEEIEKDESLLAKVEI